MTIFFIIIGILAVFIVVILLYFNKAFPKALEIAEGEMELVGKDYCFFGDKSVGFIIFSGVKTDDRAYAYIAKLLHEAGYTVIIPKQLFHISAFGTRHGMEIMESHPKVRQWILIGHSLGGMPASRIAAARPDKVMGIALLATFASTDLSGLDISAIRICAENDGIMNNENMDRFSGNLPSKSDKVMIKGANHQGFGAYDALSNRDGEASITWQEQNEQSVRLILDFFAGQLSGSDS